MSVRGSTSRGGGSSSRKDSGKSPQLSKPPVSNSPVTGTTICGPLIPHPSYPGISVPSPSNFQVLGQIPKPFSSVLASQTREIDPFCDPNPTPSTSQPPKRSDYVLNYQVNLFHIEPHMKPKNDPIQLAAGYFPPSWHFIPFAPYKGLGYYKDILISTESIHIKPIFDKNDSTKVIFHSLYIKKIISETEWGCPPSSLKRIDKPSKPVISDEQFNFCYFDYIEAWSKIFLHQNSTFSHSWFIQFDHKFKSQIPFWFTTWWSRYGPGSFIFPESLLDQVTYFSHKARPIQHKLIPLLLQFVSKYKIPWILRWQYNIHSPVIESSSQSTTHVEIRVTHHSSIPVVSRIFFVKWWDKFNIQRIIGQVQAEFPPVKPSSSTKPQIKSSKSSASLHLSDIKEYSIDQLKDLVDAIKDRHSELSKTSDDDEEAAATSSSSSSQPSVNQDPYASQFQDAQDPFA